MATNQDGIEEPVPEPDDDGDEDPMPTRAYGTVMLRAWVRHWAGATFLQIRGQVEIVQDKTAFGFRMSGADRNWMAKITGPTGQIYFVPGCEVAGVFLHDIELPANADTWTLQ